MRLPVPQTGFPPQARSLIEPVGPGRDACRRVHMQKVLFYGATTDRLPPTTGNAGAVATTLSGISRITPGPVCSALPPSVDHPCAGPAWATGSPLTPAYFTA